MKDIIEAMRRKAAQLLSDGTVHLVIGYGQGSMAGVSRPVFISRPEEAEQLTFDPFCAPSLVKYLTDYASAPGRVAICVKGCDMRGINRLITDGLVARENLYLLGISCQGLLDPALVEQVPGDARIKDIEVTAGAVMLHLAGGEKLRLELPGSWREKCLRCAGPLPEGCDCLIGESSVVPLAADNFADLAELESMSLAERGAYWDAYFARCLRCYACRQVCPACTCRSCVFDRQSPPWVSKKASLGENTVFHLTRAFHVAGRCVDCGACQQVCPVGIPVHLLNRKMIKDMSELYHIPVNQLVAGGSGALGSFDRSDPEEFM
ncbi:MAG: 4Fe-4S dicluster domain-containing protein [Desulfurispora sp.]|uniref:4Fe-4S dicluster domain-containing protein n=1 Tax=Desulfurispora sp. TaxID=3014275 RepID=UPI00404BA2A0